MAGGLIALEKMVYPGRVIVIGKTPDGKNAILYAITGRSPSSQARRLEVDNTGKHVFVKPTDEETLKTGQPDLLVYSAIICGNGIVVGNGKQTTDIAKAISLDRDPAAVLVTEQTSWQYEPDEPNYTPRISGCITASAALSVLKRAGDGSVVRNYLGVPLIAGRGYMIATYTGVNANPLPSFVGEPIEVAIEGNSAEECVGAMYNALGPNDGEPDFRVSAVCAVGKGGEYDIKVRNRHA